MDKLKKYCNEVILGTLLIVTVILRFSKMLWHRDFWFDEAF
jgi:hypothetical protein